MPNLVYTKNADPVRKTAEFQYKSNNVVSRLTLSVIAIMEGKLEGD